MAFWRRTRGARGERRETIQFYLFTLPWILGFLVFKIGPMFISLYYSFTRYGVFEGGSVFIGVQNYRRAFTEDLLFWQALKVTITYAATSVPLVLIVGLAIALLLNTEVPGLSVWRALYYLPSILSGVAVAILFALIFQPDHGIINRLLALVGIEGPKWIYDRQWALPSLVIMSLWNSGGGMIIYLASLQGIPTSLYDAATIDGAGSWARFSKITLPLMTPVIFFNLITGMVGSFRAFTNAYVMTRGGPQNATMFYGLYLYFVAFQQCRMGYASMLAWVLFAIVMVQTALLLRSSSSWVHYEGELG